MPFETVRFSANRRFTGSVAVPPSVSRYVADLNGSFAAVYRLLERPGAARRAVVSLLVIQSGLLAYSAYVHSPTLNEPGHLVAGLSHWKFGRFDIYSVNPPLVRMVAALPVMAAGYEEDWNGFYSGAGARPEFKMGEDFVVANGERSFLLFMIARWACIPFSWIGGIVCYLWARDLYGRPAGVTACCIWCIEPNILAHASLMTPDAPATALGLAACYTFWRWLKSPTWSQAALTGVVLGLAELAKTTLILFYPLWPVMWIVYRLMERRAGRRDPSFGETRQRLASLSETRNWLREGGMLALRMAIGLYVLSLGYGFEGSFKPLGDYAFVSDLFTGHAAEDISPPLEGGVNSTIEPAANRFANTWLAAIPVPLPQHYLLGIDLQQRDFEHYGRPSYLRGEWRDHGWWYYYLYAAAIKVPLGLWALGAIALISRISRRRREVPLPNREGHGEGHSAAPPASSLQPPASPRDHFIPLFPPLVVFIVVSSKTGFSEHFRYVLPCLPFPLVAISGILSKFLDKRCCNSVTYGHGQRALFCALAAPCSLTLLLWCFASSAWVYPHSLSYFNELIGGPLNAAEHLLGSNLDWGQDLRSFRTWYEQNPDKRPTIISIVGYSGASIGNPVVSGLALRARDVVPLQSPMKTGKTISLESGWYVVSLHHLRGYLVNHNSQLAMDTDRQDTLTALNNVVDAVPLGYSMRIINVR